MKCLLGIFIRIAGVVNFMIVTKRVDAINEFLVVEMTVQIKLRICLSRVTRMHFSVL